MKKSGSTCCKNGRTDWVEEIKMETKEWPCHAMPCPGSRHARRCRDGPTSTPRGSVVILGVKRTKEDRIGREGERVEADAD